MHRISSLRKALSIAPSSSSPCSFNRSGTIAGTHKLKSIFLDQQRQQQQQQQQQRGVYVFTRGSSHCQILNNNNNNNLSSHQFQQNVTTSTGIVNGNNTSSSNSNSSTSSIRLSKLISQKGMNMQMSRKSAESIITEGQVTVAGKVVTDPNFRIHYHNESFENNNGMIDINDDGVVEGTHRNNGDKLIHSIKVAGRHFIYDDKSSNMSNGLQQQSHYNMNNTNNTDNTDTNTTTITATNRTRVWLVHKLKGELVAEHDPLGRPSLIERLYRGGVGKPKKSSKNNNNKVHLKPIGRLDMMTEGLILITNDGSYVRQMTLPSNQIHRTYRVRVHGQVTQRKLNAIRKGITINNIHYKGMKVQLELTKSSQRIKGGNTNSWLCITCTEGKNRMIRKVLDHMGLQVTRLIRISFGDYDLNTIPPGLAIEVPVKSLESQRRRGVASFQNNHTRSSSSSNVNSQKKKTKEQSHSAVKSPPNSNNASVTWVRYT